MAMKASAMVKDRLAATSSRPRPTIQRLNMPLSCAPWPMARMSTRQIDTEAMPRISISWNSGACSSASFMQLSEVTNTPIDMTIARMARRLLDFGIAGAC